MEPVATLTVSSESDEPDREAPRSLVDYHAHRRLNQLGRAPARTSKTTSRPRVTRDPRSARKSAPRYSGAGDPAVGDDPPDIATSLTTPATTSTSAADVAGSQRSMQPLPLDPRLVPESTRKNGPPPPRSQLASRAIRKSAPLPSAQTASEESTLSAARRLSTVPRPRFVSSQRPRAPTSLEKTTPRILDPRWARKSTSASYRPSSAIRKSAPSRASDSRYDSESTDGESDSNLGSRKIQDGEKDDERDLVGGQNGIRRDEMEVDATGRAGAEGQSDAGSDDEMSGVEITTMAEKRSPATGLARRRTRHDESNGSAASSSSSQEEQEDRPVTTSDRQMTEDDANHSRTVQAAIGRPAANTRARGEAPSPECSPDVKSLRNLAPAPASNDTSRPSGGPEFEIAHRAGPPEPRGGGNDSLASLADGMAQSHLGVQSLETVSDAHNKRRQGNRATRIKSAKFISSSDEEMEQMEPGLASLDRDVPVISDQSRPKNIPNVQRSAPISFKPIPSGLFHRHSQFARNPASTLPAPENRATTASAPASWIRRRSSNFSTSTSTSAATTPDLPGSPSLRSGTRSTSPVGLDESATEGGAARSNVDSRAATAPRHLGSNPEPFTTRPSVRRVNLEAEKFLPKEFDVVGASERMLRKRSKDGTVQTEKPHVPMPNKKEARLAQSTDLGGEKTWLDLLKIDQGPKVPVPIEWQPPPQPSLVRDPEDSINECIHKKQVLFALRKVVLDSTSIVSRLVDHTATLSLRLESHNTIHGFPPVCTLASQSVPFRLALCSSDPVNPEDKIDAPSSISLCPDSTHPLAAKPLAIPFDPNICRRAGTVSILLLLSLEIGGRVFETRFDLCSVTSPIESLVPKSGSPFLPFEGGTPTSGIVVSVDIVPLRKQIISAEKARIEVERRLARIALDRQGIWIPDAQAITREGRDHKEVKMTKLPYRTNDTVRDWCHDTPENTSHWVQVKDDEISRSTASPQEKLIARAHMRWGLLNPYPPSVYDREIACWVHYAPLVHHFSLRFELARLLITRLVRHHLVSEDEVRKILTAYDVERERIERGERRGYEELRREALWQERGEQG
ncbi:hypothetical protein JCM11491_004103 [Sporobolomyces phaffii]